MSPSTTIELRGDLAVRRSESFALRPNATAFRTKKTFDQHFSCGDGGVFVQDIGNASLGT